VDDNTAVPVEIVADYLHSVIGAHRAFYTQVVERMQKRGKIVASENWQTTHMLPLPVQLLRKADELGAQTGSKIRYRLIGLSPINKQNAPVTDRERRGLEEVMKHPEHRYSGLISAGDARLFQAIYADRASARPALGAIICTLAAPSTIFNWTTSWAGWLSRFRWRSRGG
jgi:hypothetical protein